MKKFWTNKTRLWLAASAIAVSVVTVGFVGNVGASDDDDSWATTEYLLVRDLELDVTNDKLVSIGKPENDVLTLTTGTTASKPKCGSKCTASACASQTSDSIYPATGAAYYGTFTMALSSNNLLEGRIPKNVFIKGTGYINPSKKMDSIVLLTDAYNDGSCLETVDGETWTMRKYKVNMD